MSSPIWTSPPTITREGQILHLNNGGWICDSGPVSTYVFVLYKDSTLIQGSIPPLHSPPDLTLPGQDVSSYTMQPGERGVYRLEVYGGTHSRYLLSDGRVAYDVIEWGRVAAGGAASPASSPPYEFGEVIPPAANPPAAIAVLENIVLPLLKASICFKPTTKVYRAVAAIQDQVLPFLK